MADALLIDIERRFPGGPSVRARLEPLIPGTVTVLFGPSGAGKSTILRCIAGLERPDGGAIRCGGRTWSDSRTFLPPQARGVGFLFQDYALFPHLTVAQNIGFGVRDRMMRDTAVASMLSRFGLGELARRRPHQISGGQAQRVALARALAPNPSVLLLDEPLSALDIATRMDLRRDLRSLLRDLDVPSLVVTHDRTEALALGDRLVLLAAGEVLQDGPAWTVFARPGSGRAARVLGIENVWKTRVEDGRAIAGSLSFGFSGAGVADLVVCVHADDVDLVPVGAGQAVGRIVGLEAEGATVRVLVDAGVSVVARVHRDAAEGLSEGGAVGLRVAPEHAHAAPA